MVTTQQAGASRCRLGARPRQAAGEQEAERPQGRAQSLREGHHAPVSGDWGAEPAVWGVGHRRVTRTSCTGARGTQPILAGLITTDTGN